MKDFLVQQRQPSAERPAKPKRAERRHPQHQQPLVVLTCREPAPVDVSGKGNSGGLVAALAPVMERNAGTWISGRPGGQAEPGQPQEAEPEPGAGAPPYRKVAARYPGNLQDGFYTRFSNGVLWPLYHSMLHKAGACRSSDWRDYRRVNQYFAAVAAEQCATDAFVWVHDYQLSLVPKLLREIARGDLDIGFFLHTPFPSYDVFRTCPWARELLEGMLAADLIGFHIRDYVKNFCESAHRLLGAGWDSERDELYLDGRTIRVRAVPVGIDAGTIYGHLNDPWVQQTARRLRAQMGGDRLLLGVDRLDYTKGIDRRLEAMDLLLTRHPELRGRAVLAQIAVPSRVEIESYQRLRVRLEQLAGHVNGRWGQPQWNPVNLFCRSYPLRELVAWYLAADVAVVTPYRDGMNLVAKEFCAAHRDRPGVLVLSELAGAADELSDAFLVNPYDLEGMTETLRRALSVSVGEANARMRRMNDAVRTNDAHGWVETFLAEAQGLRRC